MSSITRTITVTRKGMQHQIQVVEGTSLLPISVIVSDYDILSGSAAVAYNRQPNGTLVNQACTISENTISFTPPEGFYLKGYNKTQVRVTNNNRNLFSFVIDVWCDENITDDADVEEINSQPTLVTQLLSQIGVLTARMDAFTALPEGSTTSDAALNDIRIGYDGTEYPTPGDAVRGQVGSLSEKKVPMPETDGEIDNGTNNQVLMNLGNRQTKWLDKDKIVEDGSLDASKLSSDLQKSLGVGELDVYGLVDSDYEAVDITDQFTPGNYNQWTETTNVASGTVLSPIFKTPQKIKIINNNTSSISSRVTRFLNSNEADRVQATLDTETANSDRWQSNIPAQETKVIYTHEWGRTGFEYMQIRWTSGAFSSWKGKFQVIAYYTDKRPEYKIDSQNDGFEHDVDIKWGAAVNLNVGISKATLYAIVPFIPGKKYTIKGGYWVNTASTNIDSAYALYDDSLLNNYYPVLRPASGNSPIQPPIRNILSEMAIIESGAHSDSIGIVTYTCPDPSETNDYPKWVAFALSAKTKPTVEDTSITYSLSEDIIQDWIENIITNLNNYVTQLDTLIDRPTHTKNFVNPYVYTDDDGSRFSALQAGSSPLCGEKWVLFGDSITDNFGGDTRIGDYFVSKISREFGLIPDNRAKSGSNINDGDENYSNLCGINMLDAFLQEIDEGTTEQPGYITIAYGHNSYSAHVGSVDDTSAEHRNSICGSMKYFIEKIREKCPGTVFGFILPYQSDWSKSTVTNSGKDIAAGRQAMLSVLQSEGYQVPYIDMWTQSGITVDMLSDAIHIGSGVAQTLYYHAMRRFMMGL